MHSFVSIHSKLSPLDVLLKLFQLKKKEFVISQSPCKFVSRLLLVLADSFREGIQTL